MSDMTQGFAKNLLKTRSKNSNASAATQVQKIFVGDQLKMFKHAVNTQATSVVIGGRTFQLRYKEGRVLFNPTEGHVPCGAFDINKVLTESEGL